MWNVFFLCHHRRDSAMCIHLILSIRITKLVTMYRCTIATNSKAIMNNALPIDKYYQLNQRVNHEIA